MKTKMNLDRAGLGFACLIFGLACGFAAHIFTQQPKVWCNAESTGIALLKDHYRSWSVSYSDGITLIDGTWQPIWFRISNGVPVECRKGYRWPTFHHSDMEHMHKILIRNSSYE